MSAISVGPRIVIPFPVMTNAGFPYGLRCAECSMLITDGHPYTEKIQAITPEGGPVSTLTCVYC